MNLFKQLFGKKKRRRVKRVRQDNPSPAEPARAAPLPPELDLRLPQADRVTLAAKPIQVVGTFGRNATEPLPKRRR